MFTIGGQSTKVSDDDWADFQDSTVSMATSDVTQNTSFSMSNMSHTSASMPEMTTSASTGSGLVNVKKDALNTSEILGLFKVKSEPVTNIKSKDDDTSMSVISEHSSSQSIDKLHGIRQSSSSPDSLNLRVPPTISNVDDDDNFFAPPPMDDFGDDEHDEYSRGYDFDDILKQNNADKKRTYGGVYGVNENFVLQGHKKKSDLKKSKGSDFNVESDNDSDSVKDFDMFKRKLSTGKPVEDSQSIASLEFVVNKNLQIAKDDGDTQSHSSNEFGNFELGQGKDAVAESKSLDSLELKQDNVSEVLDNGNSVQESSSSEMEKANEGSMTGGLPVLGDRYSAILSPEPSVSRHFLFFKEF